MQMKYIVVKPCCDTVKATRVDSSKAPLEHFKVKGITEACTNRTGNKMLSKHF